MDKKRNDSFIWVESVRINLDGAGEAFPDGQELD